LIAYNPDASFRGESGGFLQPRDRRGAVSGIAQASWSNAPAASARAGSSARDRTAVRLGDRFGKLKRPRA